jgi:hypothetical protein
VLSGAADIAGASAPGIGPPVHDISPRLEVQLVLELKGRETGAEVLQVFPCSRLRWFTLSVHQHLAHAPGQSCSGNLGRGRYHSAVQEWWKQRWGGRRGANELLKDADVEHIVEAGSGHREAAGAAQPH